MDEVNGQTVSRSLAATHQFDGRVFSRPSSWRESGPQPMILEKVMPLQAAHAAAWF